MNRSILTALILFAMPVTFAGVAIAQSTPTGYVVTPSGDMNGNTDAAAIEAAVASECIPKQPACTIYLAAPLYINNVNLVDLYSLGIVFVGLSTYNNANLGPTVTVVGSASQGFDLSGTSGVTFKDMSISGSTTLPPKTAIYAARTSKGVTFGHVFENVAFGGSFSVAAVYDFAGEGWKFHNSSIGATSGHGGYFTSKNSLGLTSLYDSSSSSSTDMTLTSFNDSSFGVAGSGAHCLWFEGATSGNGFNSNAVVETINIHNSYFNASGSSATPGACLEFDDVVGGIHLSGNRDESAANSGTYANEAFAVFKSSVTNSITSGIVWEGNQFYSKKNIIDASAANIYDIRIKTNKAESALTYLFDNIQIADIGPLNYLEYLTATGNAFGVDVQVASQNLLANIALPLGAGAIVGDDRLYIHPTITGGGSYSYTMTDYTQRLFINPSSPVTSAAITTAPHPADGQKLFISCTSAIPALTITPNKGQTISGAPSSLPANGTFALEYLGAQATWYRIQ